MASRILMVDDHPGNLEMLSFLVGAFGHEPVAAVTGSEAVDLVRAAPPDLVLLDIQMPGMDGFETLRVIRALPGMQKVPVVAVSALAMVGDREVGLASGFDAYLTKPIEPEVFAALLLDVLPGAHGHVVTSGDHVVGGAP